MGAGRAMSNRYVKTLFSRLHVTGERLQYTSAPICSSSHTQHANCCLKLIAHRLILEASTILQQAPWL